MGTETEPSQARVGWGMAGLGQRRADLDVPVPGGARQGLGWRGGSVRALGLSGVWGFSEGVRTQGRVGGITCKRC